MDVGKIGENIASAYLFKNGYKLIGKNYWKKIGEIDIIGISKNGVVVFFEVKTMVQRGYLNILSPEDNFTRLKFKKLKNICSLFAAKHQKIIDPRLGWRIDLLAITINRGNFKINHYKNVFK